MIFSLNYILKFLFLGKTDDEGLIKSGYDSLTTLRLASHKKQSMRVRRKSTQSGNFYRTRVIHSSIQLLYKTFFAKVFLL